LQAFAVLRVRSAKSSEHVIDRLPNFAHAVAAVPARKVIRDSPQSKHEQDQTDNHSND